MRFHLCWLVVLSCAVGCGSCKKSGEPSAPDAGAAAEKPIAAPDAAIAIAEAPVQADFEPTLATLSVFEPTDGGCQWRKVDPKAGRTFVIASFPGSCQGARSSLSPGSKKGAVWFDPGTYAPSAFSQKATFQEPPAPADAGDRLYAVELSGGEAVAVPVPALGELRDFGVDDKGRLLALTLRDLTDKEKEAQKVVVEGETLKMGEESEGIPVVVHALSFEDGGWVRFESKLSTDGWDYALGTSALDADKELQLRSAQMLEPRLQGDGVDDEALLATLQAWGPKLSNGPDGSWIFFGAGGERIYVYENVVEFTFNSGVVLRAQDDGGVAPLPKWPYDEDDVVALGSRGPFLLAAQDIAGTHPRLYELPSGNLVFSSDTARATTFWPVPSSLLPKVDEHR